MANNENLDAIRAQKEKELKELRRWEKFITRLRKYITSEIVRIKKELKLRDSKSS